MGIFKHFYLISPLSYPIDSLYSECDIEYLPYNVWDKDNNMRSSVYFSTWESYQTSPFRPDYALDSQVMNLWGWHILLCGSPMGVSAIPLISLMKLLSFTSIPPNGSTVYPESFMQLAFANWITSTSDEFSVWRESEFKADWVYHAADTTLDFFEIRRRVNELRKSNISFLNDLKK